MTGIEDFGLYSSVLGYGKVSSPEATRSPRKITLGCSGEWNAGKAVGGRDRQELVPELRQETVALGMEGEVGPATVQE